MLTLTFNDGMSRRRGDLLLLVLLHLLVALYAHAHGASNRRVVVVGGGAAGYFSALQCKRVCRDNADVLILEASMETLAKVAISGGGRCNVMHDPQKSPLVISKGYPRGSKELLGPLTSKFGPWDAFDWFTSRGVVLKTEDDGRVFPITDKSQTIIDVLTNEAASLGVVVCKGARVISVKKRQQGSEEERGFVIEYMHEDKIEVLDAKKVIFATGGARPGYKMMRELGHSLEEPLPSLFSFKVNDHKLLALAGTSSRNARVKLLVSKEVAKEHKALLRPQMIPLLTQQGPILVTHQGLSGPAILRLSAYGAKIFHKLQYTFAVQINWLRFTEKSTIATHLKNEKERHPQRLVGKGFPTVPLNLLMQDEDDEEVGATINDFSSNQDEDNEGGEEVGSLTRRLWHYLLAKADTELITSTPIGTLKWAEVTNKMVEKIASLVSECEFQVTGRGQYRDEFVTCGGVSLKDIAIDEMASKKVSGLYLCGEVVDVDGITGGYNFMSAWCTGYVAGNSCGLSLLSN